MPTTNIDDLDEFTRAYIECALWSSNDESTPSGGEPLDKNYSIEDIAPKALARMVADCARFQSENAALLEKAVYKTTEYTTAEMAGHDFWLTRCRHGVGFWDRDLGEVGEKLTEAAKKFGECWLIVGDDEKVYLT